MEKWKTSTEVYRLPPDKKHPKGIRVRRAMTDYPPYMGVPVVCVKDGHMFFTKKELTMEK